MAGLVAQPRSCGGACRRRHVAESKILRRHALLVDAAVEPDRDRLRRDRRRLGAGRRESRGSCARGQRGLSDSTAIRAGQRRGACAREGSSKGPWTGSVRSARGTPAGARTYWRPAASSEPVRGAKVARRHTATSASQRQISRAAALLSRPIRLRASRVADGAPIAHRSLIASRRTPAAADGDAAVTSWDE